MEPMNMSDKLNNKTETPTPRPKSKLRLALYIMLSMIVVLLLLVALLAVLVLGSPVKHPPPAASADLMVTNMRVINQIMKEISVQFPKDRATLVLTPVEVKNLLDAMRTLHFASGSKVKGPSADSYSITYEDRIFTLDHSTTQKGLTFNIHAEFTPEFTDRTLLTDTRQFKIGSFPVPAWFVDRQVREANPLLLKQREYKLLCETLISLKVLPDGNVEIIYNPGKVMEQMPGGFTGSNAALGMLKNKTISKDMLLYLKTTNFDPAQLRNIPPFKFNPALLNNLNPADLPSGLYDELKSGEFNPDRIIPLLKK